MAEDRKASIINRMRERGFEPLRRKPLAATREIRAPGVNPCFGRGYPAFPGAPLSPVYCHAIVGVTGEREECERGDLNPYGVNRWILSPVRLPGSATLAARSLTLVSLTI